LIYTGWVTLNGELLASKLGGEDGAPENLDPRADLRQNSEMGFQPSPEYGRLQLALAMLDDCLRDDQQANSFVPVFFTAVFTELDG
jgi:hypothetical protein